MATLVRPLRSEEIAAVIEDVRAAEPGSERAERLASPFGQFWLASFDDSHRARLEREGVDVHPVPASWDESRFRTPEELAADIARNSGLDSPDSEPGLAVEALVVAPNDVPIPSCSTTPAPNTFCPYAATSPSGTATSTTGGFTCSTSLRQQLLDGEATYPPILIGGSMRDYYRVVTVGTTTGQSFSSVPLNRPVTGVRIGRAPDATVPVVRQAIILGGQHGNEWGSPAGLVGLREPFTHDVARA
jgi:hypothetical protein